MPRKSANGRVNLNRASLEELDGIYGVGPTIAKKLIEYRDNELGGRFHSLHDITHIDGIGEKTAQLIMEGVTLD